VIPNGCKRLAEVDLPLRDRRPMRKQPVKPIRERGLDYGVVLGDVFLWFLSRIFQTPPEESQALADQRSNQEICQTVFGESHAARADDPRGRQDSTAYGDSR